VDVVVARMRAGVAGAGADVVVSAVGDEVAPEQAASASAEASETTAQRVARNRRVMTGEDMRYLLKNGVC